VPNVMGPTTTIEVRLASGVVVKVPRSLRESMQIDSDGDGIVNGQDATPFDGAKFANISVVNKPPMTAVIQWSAAAGASYNLEYVTSLSSSDWKLIKTVKSSSAVTSLLSYEDPIDPTAGPKYYRLRFNPLDGIVNP